MTAGREPVRVCIQNVDLETGTVSHARQLPGKVSLGPLLYGDPNTPALAGTAMLPVVSDRPGPGSWTFLNVLRATPAGSVRMIPCMNMWRMAPACLLPKGGAVATGWCTQEGYGFRGCIQYFNLNSRDDGLPALIQFAGRPAATIPISERRVAVICEDDLSQSSVLRLFDLNESRPHGEPIELEDAKAISTLPPGGIAFMHECNTLLALTCGRISNEQGLDSASWLHAVNLATGQETGKSVELPGVADAGKRCIFTDGRLGCWIATQPPGAEYAYLTRVRTADDGALVQEAQIIFGAVAEGFVASVRHDGERIAAASGNRIELRDASGTHLAANSFEGPIAAIKWIESGILAAEVGRIHLLSAADAVAAKTVQLQSGWVKDFVVIPPAAKTPAPPAEPSPELDIPKVMLFRGASAGREVKAISIGHTGGQGGWTASFDNRQMPWLVMHPPFGTCPGVLYMGVDPARYTPGHPSWGWLKISVPLHATHNVLLGIIPEEQSQIRRILWVWGASELQDRMRKDAEHPLHDVAGLLSSPPRYFAHAESAGRFQGSLNGYSVVVLTAEAARQGAITRPMLLDYVLNGGALFFLGSCLPDSGPAGYVQWLNPMDIEINLAKNVSGRFSRTSEHWLTRHWNDFEVTDGCGIHTGVEHMPLVPTAEDPREAVFVAANYGRGRFAALAAATPLENNALASEENREFAADLFEWLAAAGKDSAFQDMDGDNSPDETEDKNQNGVVDPGETDYLVPDTDGDGIPDGDEDANGNGRVDDTETSPLVADTDGDGILDGADYTPLPPIGAPFISAVTPAAGPAEGGTLVMLTGRNFTPDSAVSFGGRASPNVRLSDTGSLLAEAPPQGEVGPTVDVRVYSPASQEGYLMPEGYCYTERSRIAIVYQTLAAVKKQNDIYEGTLTLAVRNPDHAAVNRLVLILAPEKPGSIEWGLEKEQISPNSLVRESEGRLVLVSAYLRGQVVKEGPMATVPFSCTPGTAPCVKLITRFAGATAPNNQPVGVDMPEVVIPVEASLADSAKPAASDTISP